MEKKIDELARLMKKGDWEAAIKFAAKFPRLGKERNSILTASSALLSPAFYQSMGKDVDALVQNGIDALKTKYGACI